jgi:catechol 2,3-dioxygenase-like lactoylglutathione lyase family enzyme
MILAVDHINLVVADLERSVDFYTRVLGFKETRRARLSGDWIEKIIGLRSVRAEVAYVVAPAGEPRIELLSFESPQGEPHGANSVANTPGLRHLALRVDDIASAVEQLRAEGVAVLCEPVRVPVGVVRHDAGEKTLCYFLDPDGVLLELTEYS